ncbi:inositol-pentakisphosphate 2-kinase-domain-containing protein [Suillus spraguei]|nr:inositol-pentakisphosphate 2-kinase-domain-containing protein [Suillus spraguei]
MRTRTGWEWDVASASSGLNTQYQYSLITETKPQDWIHVSEGAATIVFWYQGPHNVKFSDHLDYPMIAFQENIISKLVPSEFLPSLAVVVLDEDWLRSREKDQIDVCRSKGVLATDLIGGTSIAIEIQPTWGFLPTECHLSPATAALKTATCRFCMHTSFKMEQGGFGTTYYPLDLFFPAIRRMANPDDDHSMQLLALFFTANELTDVQDLRESFISVLSQPLLDSPVLPLLSTLQRTLDILDIEGLSKLYTQTSPDCPYDGIGSSVPDPAVEEWEDFVKVYQSDYHSWDHTVLNPEHLRHYLIAYLLSATFKDCSIIIRPKSSQSMNRLGKWEKLDMKIMEHYHYRSSGRQRRCIDGQRVK